MLCLNALKGWGLQEMLSQYFFKSRWCFFWQMRSVSRWSGCAGPPEVTYRSSASTSNAGGRSASLAAASCDPFLAPYGPVGRAKNRGCKLEIHLHTRWKRPLFDLWVNGGFWCTVFTHELWPLTLWYKADSCEFSLDLSGSYATISYRSLLCGYCIFFLRTITPEWCNKLPLRWIKPQSIKQGRVDLILSPEIDISLSWSAMFCHGEISFFMNSVVTPAIWLE